MNIKETLEAELKHWREVISNIPKDVQQYTTPVLEAARHAFSRVEELVKKLEEHPDKEGQKK